MGNTVRVNWLTDINLKEIKTSQTRNLNPPTRFLQEVAQNKDKGCKGSHAHM